jgi:subtilase family serine protease
MKKLYRLFAALMLLVPMVLAPVNVTAQGAPRRGHKDVCANKHQQAVARCESKVETVDENSAEPMVTTSYSQGLTPADLHSAYALPALPAKGTKWAWNGQTIAVVAAYDSPSAAADLLAYRKQFNLPLCSTTVTNPAVYDLVGCFFHKYNQTGQSAPFPADDSWWAQEINLDTQMVSAICPMCKMIVIEANSANYSDLVQAQDRAASMGATVINDSFSSVEWNGETSSLYNGHFNHPGIATTVATGDSGYGSTFPASSQYVTAVGGTSLTKNTSVVRGWNETGWSGGNSGCSAYITQPSWQWSIGSCSNRKTADVSAVADPNTGVAVYYSANTTGQPSWYVFGGTSVAAPIIAGVYALAGNSGGAHPTVKYGEYPYAHRSGLNDIKSGSNGTCSVYALCHAGTGYDGVTGLGSPKGLGAF